MNIIEKEHFIYVEGIYPQGRVFRLTSVDFGNCLIKEFSKNHGPLFLTSKCISAVFSDCVSYMYVLCMYAYWLHNHVSKYVWGDP